MKRCIIFLFTMLIMQCVIAIRVTIDGLNYSLITEHHDAIISYGNKCAGKLVIPSEVSYNGQTFIVKSMLWKAFFDCPELTKVEIPKTLEEVMHYYPNDPDEGDIETILISSDYMNPFVSCAALESVEVDEENPSMKSVAGVLFSKDGTRLYAYPAGARRESYTIPDGVEWIGSEAFERNQYISSLTMPSSLKQICNNVFSGCNNLTDIYCYAENVPVAFSSAFNDFPIASATLHVPAGSVDKYKATTPWSGFGNIVAIEEIAQEYFPEGTKWTEIRLDTLKYDSWYSNVGGEWVPNFETIEYRVQGEYGKATDNYWNAPYKCVYTNTSEWTDSLTLLISEGEINGLPTGILVTVLDVDQPLWPSSYPFEWEVGTMIKFKDILAANMTALFPPDLFDFGIVEEIKEAYFGGARPLKYSDVKGVRMIQGIGVATWNDGECIFGPLKPYNALPLPHEESRHYRSMLVHFERDGEVLYDVWPEKEATIAEPVTYTAGQMATIIMPTAPDAGKGKYYRLDRVEGSEIVFEQELQPLAHVPYIIVPSEDFSIDPCTLDLAGLSSDTVSVEGVSFIGTYGRKELNEQEGFYIDIIDTTPDCCFSPSGETGRGGVIGALRAYLQVTWNDPYNQGGTKTPPMEKLQIVLKDNGTGIAGNEESRIKNEESNAAVYDLSGRQIANGSPRQQSRLGAKASEKSSNRKMPKGIYVESGRKIVVR